MAWTDADAVRIWTGGRYTVSPSMYLRRFHIEVPRDYLDKWLSYLHTHRISVNSPRGVGTTVVVTPVDRMPHSTHRGEPVIPRRDTLALIKAHRGLYADADKLVES